MRRRQPVKISPQILRSVVGLGALGLVAAGAWGFCGWPAAALVVGVPIATFYFWSQVKLIQSDTGGE
jgi:hypothetical protein